MNSLPAEYCFLWIDWWPLCMTKGEWSGWAQAIGSFMALCLAIYLAAKARRNALRDTKDAAVVFVAGVVSALDDVRDACKTCDFSDFHASRLLLRDVVQAGDFLHSVATVPGVLNRVIAVRAGAMEAFYKSEGHQNLGNWDHWFAHFAGKAAASRLLLNEIKGLRV